MAKKRILIVFGTRPEAVKLAPVIQALQKRVTVETIVCVTAQHREMLDQVLTLFKITPQIDLNLMKPDQSLASLTAEIFKRLDPVLEQIKPDWILVQGDTTTVMASALSAYYHRIHIGHVEAGLRTHDKWQPFPEEINRRVAGVVSDLHFAPTESARQNLLTEGIEDWRISVTGNPVIDALQQIIKLPEPPEISQMLQDMGIANGKRRLILVTAHRRENFGAPIEHICKAIRTLAERYPQDLQFIYPVHLNPNIQQPVNKLLDKVQNIKLLKPVEYLPLVHLMKNSYLVLTDSGGIQEEATGLGKPTLVLREVTERPEGVDAGVLRLVGTSTELIVSETRRLLEDHSAYHAMAQAANPFGDGHAAEKIVHALLNFKEQKSVPKK
jgi:UDP-N-acetylglucosamine 2-epimerase (non-hydrolysing)